jgi:VCBS repeat-containing protein
VNNEFPWIPEGNNNAQHTTDAYEPDWDNMWVGPSDTAPLGAPIGFKVEPGVGKPTIDGYLTSIMLNPLATTDDTPCGGTFVDGQGTLLTEGMTKIDDDGIIYTVSVADGICTIIIDSTNSSWKPVDLDGFGGLHYVPADSNSDLDTKIEFTAVLECVVGNRSTTKTLQGDIFIAVDAVADLPEYLGGADTEVIFEHSDSENPNLSPVLEYENGIASHTIGGAALGTEKQAVMLLGNALFNDFTDGSEEHFLLVSCQNENLQWSLDTSLFGTTGYEALVPPENGTLDTVWLNADKTEAEPDADGAVMYYKIVIDSAYLSEHEGEAGLALPLTVGAESESGSYLFDVKLGAGETVTPDDYWDPVFNDEVDFGNNLAVADVGDGVEVAVLLVKSEIKISTGWVYESGAAANGADNPDAAPDGWGFGDGATGSFSHLAVGGSTSSSAAFIKIAMPDPVDGETFGEWFSLEYDASRGDVYYPNGTLISSSAGNGVAVVNISRTQYVTLFGNTGEFTFYFIPKAGSDDDSDFFIKYGFDVIGTGAGGASHTYHISNELPVVIDAVADAACTLLAPSGAAPDFDGFVMDYAVDIHHDSSEQQYIIIANPDGLLALGNLGPAAQYLTQVEPAELQAYDNPDPDAVRYFDNLDDTYIILRVDDPAALDQLDSVSDGKLNLSLPFTVTDRESAGEEIDVAISAVVVEGGGNNPDNWSQEEHAGRSDTTPGETDFANNIAVTEKTVAVRLSGGNFTVIEAAEVYEGDKAEQHLYGNADLPEYGAVVNLSLDDSHEAIHTITFSLQAADGSASSGGSLFFGYGSGNPTAVPSGGGLRFASELGGEDNDTPCYTQVQVVDDDGDVIATYAVNPAVTLHDMLNADGPMGLRFIPSGDGDADVVVDFTARVVDLDSGDTVTVEKSLTITRDAVADLPVDASSEAAATNSGYGSVVQGATVSVTLQATFGDYADGSEAHYFFVGKEYLQSVAIPDALADSFTVLSDADADVVCGRVNGANGIPGANSDAYFVISVAPSYLSANNGTVELPLQTLLKPDLSSDGEETLNIKSVAVEYEGLVTVTGVDRDGDAGYSNVETSAPNNVAVADASSTISWATLENDFTLTVEDPAFEGDRPNQYAPGGTGAAGGAGLTLTSGDPGEIFTEMTLTYADADGQPAHGLLALIAGDERLDIPSGTTLAFTYSTTTPTLCVTVGYEDENGTHSIDVPGLTLEELTSSGLRYIPSGDSDTDVVLSVSGNTLETASGETGEKELEVTIVVDAVADLPTDASSEALPQNSGYDSVVSDNTFTINVQATFGDYADGSESHYLFVARTYLNAVAVPADLGGSFEVLSDAAAADICAQVNGTGGLPGASADAYFVVKVDAGYLAANAGEINLPLDAHLKTDLPDDGAGTFIVKAAAIEHDGYLTQTGTDLDALPDVSNEELVAGQNVPGNNVSVTDASSGFTWARLENEFAVTVESPAYENDRPARNVGSETANGGAVLKIAPADSSEVFDTLKIEYVGEDGQPAQGQVILFAGGDQLEIPSGTILTFTYAGPQSILCVNVGYTDGGGTPHSLDVPDPGLTPQQLTEQGLRYIPSAGGNDSDIDINVTFSGTTRETASGETGAFPQTTVQVIVDAVADKPVGDKTDYDHSSQGTDENNNALYNSLDDGSVVSFPVEAAFSDYADGSEAHYLFINTRYLESGSLALVDPATGQPFAGGSFITEQADITELFSRINPTGRPAGTPGFVPQEGDEYVVLQLDPEYLQAAGGNAALTVEGTLKGAEDLAGLGTEKALLDIDVKAVAVEHEGYETQETGTASTAGDELTASNNVAVTDVGVRFRWDSLRNEFELTLDTAYENDRPNQHQPGASAAGGAAVVIVPEDASEVFTKIQLEYDDTHGDIVLRAHNASGTATAIVLPPDVDVIFTFDADNPTLIIKAEWVKDAWNAGSMHIYDADGNKGMTLEDLTQSGMRYVPHAGYDGDADLPILIHADTLETNTGTTGETTLSGTVVVDAAADRPDALTVLEVVNGKNNTVVVNETSGVNSFDVNITAAFNDYEDGSEAHYIFVSKDYLSDLQGWPAGITLLDGAAAATVSDNAGLDEDYYVLEVSAGYLQASEGSVNITLTAALDPDVLPGEDTPFLVDIKAGAIEHQGYNTPVDGTDLGDENGLDSRADNNVSLVDIGVTLEYAVLDNIFNITVGNAWEGDRPDQHLPDLDPAGGAPITIVPDDSSEVFDTLVVNYDDSEGTVRLDLPTTSGNMSVAVPDGAELAFAYKNEGAGATQCVSITISVGSVSTVYTLSAPMTLLQITGSDRLRYLPDTASQSDNDVTVTFTGTARETASNETGAFSAAVVVKVDAAADHPDAAAGAANPNGREALAAGKPFNLAINTNFGADTADGSEAHYLFIGRDYLASVIIPSALTGDVEILSDADASAVCSRINGSGGIPGASADAYWVIKVSDAYLQAEDGVANLNLQGVMKTPAELQALGVAEGEELTFAVKAVAVEHQGFTTGTEDDLGSAHGLDVTADNNVSVDDASITFTYAALDNQIITGAGAAYEGDQKEQVEGDWTTLEGGAAVSIFPDDASEVFKELTLTYDDTHGSLSIVMPGGSVNAAPSGTRLVFFYDPAHPSECVEVHVYRPGETSPSSTLSFLDAATGRGIGLEDLTSGHLRYLPTAGDNNDADVQVSFSGTIMETESGEEGSTSGAVTVVVDAVADLPADAESAAVIVDDNGVARTSVKPGDEFEINVKAEFKDYGGEDASDGSEAHYLFISKEHLAQIGDFPNGVTLLTDADALTALFSAVEKDNGTGIHAGPPAAADYYVLAVGADYLQAAAGSLDLTMTAAAPSGDEECGTHLIEIKAVSVEHDGFLTDVTGIGGGTDRDATAGNNVAVADAGFELDVHLFLPEKIKVEPATAWAFENDRSDGHLEHHAPGSTDDRDNGVLLVFTEGPGAGNVVSSITFSYPAPEHGSSLHDLITSSNAGVTVTYDTSNPGYVVATVASIDPYESVGELRFVPGDNYENNDVDITVVSAVVADPALGVNTSTDPAFADPDGDWGNGIIEGAENLHIKVDAVAHKPDIDLTGVDFDSDNPVLAGSPISIKGKVSFEDLQDASEEHFVLLEIRDGYYPDAVTLSFGDPAVSVTHTLTHYQSSNPPVLANYTLQELITPDDEQPHLFCKLKVDDTLAELMGNETLYRMDNIDISVAYQTREWAEEGASLHFGAISTEDVESVREYDANFQLTNDELPFDKILEEYGIAVDHPNNTAIAVDADAVYVYWDSSDPNDVKFDREYVFENDRPVDHIREPVELPGPNVIPPFLEPEDSVTLRGLGTAKLLNIPAGSVQVEIDYTPGYPQSNGSFYFLPEDVWDAFAAGHPTDDSPLAAYKVTFGGGPKIQPGTDNVLVFIPENEAYDDPDHTETGGSHKDTDLHFDYTIIADQYGPNDEPRGSKRYMGTDEVIRVDAVANQTEIILAGDLDSYDQFSLWGGGGTTSSFPLTVKFHDLDGTEDHYVLAEVVVNFGFECAGYTYTPGDSDKIYTHVTTNADGSLTTTRYYKIPVSLDQIDPVTGEATVNVNYIRLPGQPANAKYPSSEDLRYGALTEDETGSRWDSFDPAADNFVNRIGADGEYTWDNNTSVIIRNGVANGVPGGDGYEVGPNGPWGGSGGELPGGGGGGGIYTPSGPGGGWGGGWRPDGVSGGGGFWNPGGPAGGGGWWIEHGGGGGGGYTEWGLPGNGGAWDVIGHGGSGEGGGSWPYNPGVSDNPWIASRGQGFAIEWVFENSTPEGNTYLGQYNSIVPAACYLRCESPDGTLNTNGDYVLITVPEITSQLITGTTYENYHISPNAQHYRGTFAIFYSDGTPPDYPAYSVEGGGSATFTIPAPGGRLPDNAQLFFLAAPDCLDTDFDLRVQWYDAYDNQMSDGTVRVMVDAVAQWANFEFDIEDGIIGVTGDEPRTLHEVRLNVNFLDQDGSEGNYVLVYKMPGVLALHVIGKNPDDSNIYAPVKEVYLNGKTYYAFEPTADELASGQVSLQLSVNADLTSPVYVRDDIVYKGQTFTGMRIEAGTMTIEGSIGVQDNWECLLDNNTSLNLQEDALTIVVSKVNAKGGNNAVIVKETDDPEADMVKLDPDDPAAKLNLSMDENDTLTSLIFTAVTGNGTLLYEDENGTFAEVVPGMETAELYLAGKLYFKQDRYEDSDAKLTWTAEVADALTTSTAQVSGTATMAVDAVAKTDEIHLAFPIQDKDAGTLTLNLTFDDHQANEMHYAVVAPDLFRVLGKTALVFDADGTAHTAAVETIFDPRGKPYYAVRVDGCLDENGAVRVQFDLQDLNIPGIENVPVVSGGVSVEPNSGYYAADRETDLQDNWAIKVEPDLPARGFVQTEGLAFAAAGIAEDSAAGSPVTLLSDSVGENDIITAAALSFAVKPGTVPSDVSTGFDGAAGEQVATLVYDGACFAVTLDGAGNAVAALDFGAAGFDAAADFRIIWGTAHTEDGTVVVDSYNHAATGTLDLNTAFTVTNTLTGLTATLTGADPNGIGLTGSPDAGEDITGAVTGIAGNDADPDDPIGAGADSVTVSLTGEFADSDGSETHYLFLEVPVGWTVLAPAAGQIEVVNTNRYYRVEVDGTDAQPAIPITLLPPDGINSDVALKTASRVVEDSGNAVFTQGGDVTLHLSDVSATGLEVDAEPVIEDGLFSLAALGDAALTGADGNDALLSVTFTDLQGGTIVDADGEPLTRSPMTFTRAELDSGDYFYKPAENYAGAPDALNIAQPVTLTYNAVLGETDTGAVKNLVNLQLSVTVTPEADAPVDVAVDADTDDLSDALDGHKTVLPLHLEATFADTDGSEQHFFVVHVPAGAIVKSGDGYTAAALTTEEINALDGQFPTGGALYKVVVGNTLSSVSLDVNLEITATAYNGGSAAVVGGAAELLEDGTHSFGFSGQSSTDLPAALDNSVYNLAPVAVPSAATMDSWRDADKVIEGTVDLDVDPDGDTVSVSGLAFGEDAGTRDTFNGADCWTVSGNYGTLHLFDDGTYSYHLNTGADGADASEVFSYTLADGYGGSGQNSITVTLAGDNEAPFADPSEEALDSVRAQVVQGSLVYGDSDGDAVSVVAVNDVTTLTNFGTDSAPIWGYEVQGDYGTLQVYQNAGGAWQYVYALDSAHKGTVEDESFTYTVRDAYGLETSGAIDIDLYNVNTDPSAGDGTVSMDTLRDADGEASGAVALSDAENDTVGLSAVTGPNGAGAWGVDESNNTAFVVEGNYGLLYLYPSVAGDSVQYRYVLTDTTAAGINDSEVFTYTADDGYLGTDTGVITINLTNTNTAPVVTGDFSLNLDTYRTEGGVIEGSISFSDPDYNTDESRYDTAALSGIAFGSVQGASDGSGGFVVDGDHGSFHIHADGSYAYTLDSGSVGVAVTETFTVAITDEHGKTSTQAVAVNLQSDNEAPTADAAEVDFDSWRLALVDGQAVISDPDAGDTPRVTALEGGTEETLPDGRTALTATGDYGKIYVFEDGSYTYEFTGTPGVADTDVFAFTVTDGHGGSAESYITVNLTADNENPVAESETETLDTHTVTSVTGVASFYDTDYYTDGAGEVYDAVFLQNLTGPDSEAEAEEVSENGKTGLLINGEHGCLYLFADGTFRYELTDSAPGLTGTEVFTYHVADLFGGADSGNITIELENINADPTASTGASALDTWREGAIVAGSVTLADADADTVTVSGVSHATSGAGTWGEDGVNAPAFVCQGEYGTLYLYQNGEYSYILTDPAGTGGSEVFTYSVQDGYGGSAQNTITVTLTNANTAPVISGDLSAVIEGSVQDYENGAIYASGQISWQDAENDGIASLTIGGVALPSSGSVTVEGEYGTLIVSADGSYTYTLSSGMDAAGINDEESFAIVATDIYGAASQENLLVTLTPLTHAPECSDVNVNWLYTPSGDPTTVVTGSLVFSDVDSGYENSTEALQLQVNGFEVAEDESCVIEGEYGTLSINSAGLFSYTPADGFLNQPNLEHFTYAVTDQTGNTTEADLYIRLSDEAPVFPNTGDTEAGVFEHTYEASASSYGALFSGDNGGQAAFDALFSSGSSQTSSDDGGTAASGNGADQNSTYESGTNYEDESLLTSQTILSQCGG